MPDLTYDKEALRGLGSGLHDLGDRITQDGDTDDITVDDVAHERVVSALHEFADSWGDKREEVVASLSSLGDMASQSADAFEQGDEQLAADARAIIESGGQ